MREQSRQLLERKIDGLPLKYRIVFVLRALERMSAEEVSSCLRVPEATIRMRFLRARRLLGKPLAANGKVPLEDAFTLGRERSERMLSTVLQRLSTVGDT